MRNNRPEVQKQRSSTNGKSSRALRHAADRNNLGEIWLDCGPLEAEHTETWRPAIEMLTKIYRVPNGAALHPNLAFADRPWPSPSFGPVAADVLEYLLRARAVYAAHGFRVDADPVNPLGDGKSWVLVVEPTDNLSKGADPIELARQCQLECVQGAAQPVRNEQIVLVPLWDSGYEDAIQSSDSQRGNTPLKPQSRSARSGRKEFVNPILKEKGWSPHEWASESKVDWHTVNGYLRGETRPYPSTLKKFAASLGVKPEDLPE